MKESRRKETKKPERKPDTRVARPLPRFTVATAVKCNRCEKVLYSNAGNVEEDQILTNLQAASLTWATWGAPGHVCDKRRARKLELESAVKDALATT